MKESQTTSSIDGFVLNLAELKSGDVILEAGYKPHSEAIKIKTGSHYSHAIIFLENSIFESTMSGSVFTRVPNRFYVKNEKDLKVIRHKTSLSNESLEFITMHARTSIGTSYSISEAIISSKKNRPSTKKNNSQFCSRFVAECLNAGGIKAVDNIHYCTPAELENSGEFSEVQNAVKKATPEEMKHATSGRLHPKHQKATVEWIKKAKKLLKPNNNKVQTSGDIFQAILDAKNLKLDRAVAKAMIESGYTDNYNDDKEINTYRYDAEEFSTRLKNGDISIEEEVRKEISIFRLQMKI